MSLGTTRGLRLHAEELVRVAREAGLSVALVTVDLQLVRLRWGRFGHHSPVLDLAEALASRRSAEKFFARDDARLIIYTTTTSAMLEPLSRRRRGVLRVDALARTNRVGSRNWILRFLESLTLRTVRAVWLMSESERVPHAPAVVVPPTTAPSRLDVPPRDPDLVLTFVGGPKKRPQMVIEGFEAASERWGPGKRLVIAGTDEASGRKLLPSGFRVPDSVTWLGDLSPEGFRSYTAAAAVFLAAPKYEDYGAAALEAMADGCLLVTTPSPGPYVARRVAEGVDPSLVSQTETATGLADALIGVWERPPEELARTSARVRRAAAECAGGDSAARLTELIMLELRRWWA